MRTDTKVRQKRVSDEAGNAEATEPAAGLSTSKLSEGASEFSL